MKKLVIFLFMALNLLNSSYAQKKNHFKKFSVECTVATEYVGYIYLEYENKKDSCLIVNKHFSFSGQIQQDITSATFSLKNKDTNAPSLFLEPGKIAIEMSIEEKKLDDQSTVAYMKIIGVEGSPTTQAAIDYSTYIQKHNKDQDFRQALYIKVDAIVTQNPINPLGCSLICGLSRDDTTDKKVLRKIYRKLNKENQNKMLLNIIDQNLK